MGTGLACQAFQVPPFMIFRVCSAEKWGTPSERGKLVHK
jgi:hypothetical protein